MNKISCGVIRDVLPLYIDGVASEDTRNLVEEHIHTCNACKAELEKLSGEVTIPVSKDSEVEKADLLNRMKKSLKKKQIRVAVLSIVLSVAVIFGAYYAAVIPTTVISYDKGLVSVKPDGNKLYVDFKGKNYSGYYGWEGKGIINGEEKNIYVFYYDENLWSKYVDPIIGKEVPEQDRRQELNAATKIDAVYYGYFEPRNTDGTMQDELNEMTMLWEK